MPSHVVHKMSIILSRCFSTGVPRNLQGFRKIFLPQFFMFFIILILWGKASLVQQQQGIWRGVPISEQNLWQHGICKSFPLAKYWCPGCWTTHHWHCQTKTQVFASSQISATRDRRFCSWTWGELSRAEPRFIEASWVVECLTWAWLNLTFTIKLEFVYKLESSGLELNGYYEL